jgi:hypothetical protein
MSERCCKPAVAPTPLLIENRAGLSALAYRIGTFAEFRTAMLDAISTEPALARLSTRTSDDYAITLIELWAAVADVLTFYQERIANEAYLRTATLRDSMIRIVRLVDYQLGRGAAATALVAFTLEPGARTPIPVGLRMQSVPVGNAQPQKYETLEALVGDARFNRVRVLPAPRRFTAQASAVRALVRPGPDTVAAATAWALGDRIAFWTTSTAPDRLAIVTLTGVALDEDRLSVAWTPPLPPDWPAATFAAFPVAKTARTFKLFGNGHPAQYNVPSIPDSAKPNEWVVKLISTDFTFAGHQTVDTTPADTKPAADQLFLDAVYQGLGVGSLLLVAFQSTVVMVQVTAVEQSHATRGSVATAITKLSVALLDGTAVDFSSVTDVRDVQIHELAGPLVHLWDSAYPPRVAESPVYLPGARSGWDTLGAARALTKGAFVAGATLAAVDLLPGRRVMLADGATTVAARVRASDLIGNSLTLATTAADRSTLAAIGFAPGVARRQTALVSAPLATTATLTNAAPALLVTVGAHPPQTISAAASGAHALGDVAATMESALRAAMPIVSGFANAVVRAVTDDAGAHRLVVLAGTPDDALAIAPAAHDVDTVRELGLDAPHARYVDGLLSGGLDPAGPHVAAGALAFAYDTAPPVATTLPDISSATPAHVATALRGALAAAPPLPAPALVTALGDRVLVLPAILSAEPPAYLRLLLDADAPYDLDAATAQLSANVALASNGETVRNEVLGDGDASVPFQRFALRKAPVTYVVEPNATELSSTVTLTVDGIAWSEVPTLYAAGPRDAVYATRMADDGTESIQFGDGVHGARVTSGRANVVATYRRGTGAAGRVTAGALTALLDRPHGLKAVTNPLAADGGTDPEALAAAKANAPNTVRTFGRAIALGDFVQIALEGGAAAKAAATWVWDGERRVIHLTVAGAGGTTFSPAGLSRIAAVMHERRDPNHRLLIANYAPVAIVVAAALTVDARYDNEAVRAAATAALLDSLSFDRLRFGEPVHLSEIYTTLQNVAGVVSVDVNDLNFKSTDAAFRAAHRVDPNAKPQPHLFALPARPQPGTVLNVLPAELAVVETPSEDVTITATGGRATP